ncbi:transposase [Halosquirtibacter laminarini]|uniref:Transposase n=1 Tax=Halosquirtibacter laminarini TaxID=3374600 RepID=A0AC61NPG6_9BACT|nr:transposase [Prolixibacteraceae bacterium]
MFKRSPANKQLDMFDSPLIIEGLPSRASNIYHDDNHWHNQFRKLVVYQISEDIFAPIYCQDNGCPNYPIRILVGMMILKEGAGISDEMLFENCQFNLLYRSALGLLHASDSIPAQSTYYKFRQQVKEYNEKSESDLFEDVFTQITSSHIEILGIKSDTIRMDSKLLNSNIKWLSRYSLIHETLSLFLTKGCNNFNFSDDLKPHISDVVSTDGDKVVYRNSTDSIKQKIVDLGILISNILNEYTGPANSYYDNLLRLFKEQFFKDDQGVTTPIKGEDLSAKNMQTPFDTDCDYRNKAGDKCKGYSANLTEVVGDNGLPNIITSIQVEKVSHSDTAHFKGSIERTQEVLGYNVINIHADGAYNSEENQEYCAENNQHLYLHAIQGKEGRFRFSLEAQVLKVFDNKHQRYVDYTKYKGKDELDRYKIYLEEGKFRYFKLTEVEKSLLRQRIKETPIEKLQIRNNVEASIFQLGFHCNGKNTVYRGLIKHQMWAVARSLWVNFVRIVKYYSELNISMVINMLKCKLCDLFIAKMTLLESVIVTKIQILFCRLKSPKIRIIL